MPLSPPVRPLLPRRPPPSADPVSSALYAARIAQQLTQADVAGRLFVTPQTVAKYERGLLRGGLDRITRWAAALGLRVELRLIPVPRETDTCPACGHCQFHDEPAGPGAAGVVAVIVPPG